MGHGMMCAAARQNWVTGRRRKRVGGRDDRRWKGVKTMMAPESKGFTEEPRRPARAGLHPPDPPAPNADFHLSPFSTGLKPESV